MTTQRPHGPQEAPTGMGAPDHAGTPPRGTQAHVVATFSASIPATGRTPDRCDACTSPVIPGQRIARMSDGTYRHLGCTTWARR